MNEKKEYEIASREFEQVKKSLLYSLTNMGRPFIEVVDGNFENRGELLLRHRYEGVDLKIDWAQDTLASITKVWGRPVNILTAVGGKEKIMRFDGKEHSQHALDKKPETKAKEAQPNVETS